MAAGTIAQARNSSTHTSVVARWPSQLAADQVLYEQILDYAADTGEYGPLDKVNKLKAIADMAAVMYPPLQEVDFRSQVPRLDVPVNLVQGTHEMAAPTRGVVRPATGAHQGVDHLRELWACPQSEQFPRFRAALAEIVRTQN